MRYQRVLTAAALAQLASAFPRMAMPDLEKRAMIAGRAGEPASGVPVPDPAQVAGIFDADLQYVSNTGDHAYVPPGPGDQRGPCPGMDSANTSELDCWLTLMTLGLNAMANHGYLPHSGVATIPVSQSQHNMIYWPLTVVRNSSMGPTRYSAWALTSLLSWPCMAL